MPLKPPKELFIDTFTVRILAEAEADAEELTFSQDGSWWVSGRSASPPPGSPGDEDEEERSAEDNATLNRTLSRTYSQGSVEAALATPASQASGDAGSDDGASSVVLSSVSGEEDIELDEDDNDCDANNVPVANPSPDSSCSAAVNDPYAVCSPVDDFEADEMGAIETAKELPTPSPELAAEAPTPSPTPSPIPETPSVPTPTFQAEPRSVEDGLTRLAALKRKLAELKDQSEATSVRKCY